MTVKDIIDRVLVRDGNTVLVLANGFEFELASDLAKGISSGAELEAEFCKNLVQRLVVNGGEIFSKTKEELLPEMEQLQKELGREPHMDEIAHKVQLPASTVTLALESVVDPVSLYEPVYSDEGDTIYVMDQLGDSGGEDSWISGIMFKDTVQALSEREKKIMALRYLSGKTQVEVAKEIGISQAQVSRLEKNALGRIKGRL